MKIIFEKFYNNYIILFGIVLCLQFFIPSDEEAFLNDIISVIILLFLLFLLFGFFFFQNVEVKEKPTF